MVTSLIDSLADTTPAKKLAKLLIPHKHNNHHPYLIRHESLFVFTLLILLLQVFSGSHLVNSHVLGYSTDITRAAIINLTNQERTSRSLPPLTESTLLDQSATLKNQNMFAKDYWAHYAPDGTSPWYFFQQVGYNYTWAGENLARDFSTSEGVINGWMNSPSHRDNMLNPNFTDIGIAIGDGILQGEETTLVVEHLGKTNSVSATIPATTGTSKTTVQGQAAPVNDNLNPVPEKENSPVASANISTVNQKIASAEKSSFNLGTFWDGLGFGQRTTLLLLSFLLTAFLVDSVLVFRRREGRASSHSILHAGVLLILMVVMIKSAAGGIF